jgi:hypothetical protein
MKKIQSTKLKIDREPTGESKRNPQFNLPIVKCSCGAKILLVPDVAAMSLAVKNHLTKHKDADEQFLISQILNSASKQAQP